MHGLNFLELRIMSHSLPSNTSVVSLSQPALNSTKHPCSCSLTHPQKDGDSVGREKVKKLMGQDKQV